jgi:superfamily II DNA helicase RecQ
MGNDRPNIFMEARTMQHEVGAMKDLTDILVPAPGEDLVKTMVFFNDRATPHKVENLLQRLLPRHLQSQVAVYHAMHTNEAKEWVMRLFKDSKIKVLLCTEAAGMVHSSPDFHVLDGPLTQLL